MKFGPQRTKTGWSSFKHYLRACTTTEEILDSLCKTTDGES